MGSYSSVILWKDTPLMWTASNLGTPWDVPSLPFTLHISVAKSFMFCFLNTLNTHSFLFHLFCHHLDQATFTWHLDCFSGFVISLIYSCFPSIHSPFCYLSDCSKTLQVFHSSKALLVLALYISLTSHALIVLQHAQHTPYALELWNMLLSSLEWCSLLPPI